MTLEVGLAICYVLGMTTYIGINMLGKNTNHKTLDISDKVKKYKKIQNKLNEHCKNEGLFK